MDAHFVITPESEARWGEICHRCSSPFIYDDGGIARFRSHKDPNVCDECEHELSAKAKRLKESNRKLPRRGRESYFLERYFALT